MKNFWVVLGLGVCLNAAHAVTVDGVAYLTGQQNHGGTKVLFNEVSPSAQTDSTYTNADGTFVIDLQPGVYDVIYSHEEYATYRLPNQILLWDTTLDPVTLMPPLSGYLSGTLGPGDFQVTDSIVVDTNTSLTILPGTRLFFEYRKKFLVYGLLTAVGTESDSIFFTRRTPSADSLWGGLRFIYADSMSRIEYCIVEYARSTGVYLPDVGGGILNYSSSPTVSHCTVRLNEVGNSMSGVGGAGICIVSGRPRIEDCLISNNTAGDTYWVIYGGGMYCDGAGLIVNCVISGDSSHGTGGGVYATGETHFINCVISGNWGDGTGGVSASGNALFERCQIINNHGGYGNGAGGISITGSEGNALFRECLIANNNAQSRSGGVRCASGTLERCTITGNSALNFDYAADAVYVSGSLVALSSCVMVGGETNPTILFHNGADAEIQYCDIWTLSDSAIGYYQEDPTHAPLVFGQLITTNANGDSCDTYYNIFLDPQFADTANGDYHLLAGSPCIDAGDPELDPDPDGTVADMGAFYYSQLDAGENPFIVHRPSLIAYPNPFNSTTRIEFDLPRAGEAELKVFDVTGRAIRTLASGPLAAGHHEISFDAGQLPSGMYFYQLEANAWRQTRKMVLIR